MRLVDKVMLAPALEFVHEPDRSGLAVLGAGAYSKAVRQCPLRYVLDRSTSRQCADLFCKPGQLPDVDDLIVRLPAPDFWLELFAQVDETDLPGFALGRRVGYLVQSAEDGRSGRITCFVEDARGTARVLGAAVLFDFDRAIARREDGLDRYPMRHGELPEVNRLLGHAMLETRSEWVAHACALLKPFQQSLAEQAGLAWPALPAILSFSALINARNAVNERRPDLRPLNLARAKRGKFALLEHVEITMRLFDEAAPPGHNGHAGAGRRMPRLHFVRGHPVHRGGSRFWRASHFRGMGVEAPTTTVSVRSGPRQRARETQQDS